VIKVLLIIGVVTATVLVVVQFGWLSPQKPSAVQVSPASRYDTTGGQEMKPRWHQPESGDVSGD